MTPAQTSLYWRLWAAACRTQKWHKAGGLTAAQVEARRRAEMTAALGKAVSSKELTNDQFSRVKARFKMLTDNVTATMEVNAPERGKARNFRWVIEHEIVPCLALYLADPAEYVGEVIRGKFNRGNRIERRTMDDLSNQPRHRADGTESASELEMLLYTLSARLNTLRKEAGDSLHDMRIKAELPCACKLCSRRAMNPVTTTAARPQPEPVTVDLDSNEPW